MSADPQQFQTGGNPSTGGHFGSIATVSPCCPALVLLVEIDRNDLLWACHRLPPVKRSPEMKMQTSLISRVAALCAVLVLSPAITKGALIQTYTGSGTLGLEVAAVGMASTLTASGTLNLATFSGTPTQAYLYAVDVNFVGPLGMGATFNGNLLVSAGVYASDTAFQTLQTFRWDVTSLMIPGVTSYSFSIVENLGVGDMPGTGVSVVALAAVYSDPTLPFSTVSIFDGMQQVGESGPETESVQFTSLPAGPTKVWTLTAFDDAMSTGETIVYDGSTIGGPLDANLALNGSLHSLTGTSSAGPNTLSLTTTTDQFGWVLGGVVVVPEPSMCWLIGLGLGSVAWRRARARI